MKIFELQEEKGLTAKIETLEDLWFLSRIIEKGDLVSGESFRRFKKEEGVETRAESGEKKKIYVTIQVDSVEFSESINRLRILGRIIGGKPEEFVQLGLFHTLDLEPESKFQLKKTFLPYHKLMIKEASKRGKEKEILIVAMDEEKVLFSILEMKGIKFLFEIENHASKRDEKRFAEEQKLFFAEVLSAIERYPKHKIVLAGPGFAKENFGKYVKEKHGELLKKIAFEYASNAERSAVFELLKKGVLQKIMQKQKLQEEFSALEKLKISLAKKDGFAVYGFGEVKNSLEFRAVEHLLILDEYVRKESENANYTIELAIQQNAKITIFNSEDDAGKEFSTFKVAGLLRFRVS